MSDASDEIIELTFDLLRADQVNRFPKLIAVLLTSIQIVIVDDTNAYSLFGEDLFGAPQEDIIER